MADEYIPSTNLNNASDEEGANATVLSKGN